MIFQSPSRTLLIIEGFWCSIVFWTLSFRSDFGSFRKTFCRDDVNAQEFFRAASSWDQWCEIKAAIEECSVWFEPIDSLNVFARLDLTASGIILLDSLRHILWPSYPIWLQNTVSCACDNQSSISSIILSYARVRMARLPRLCHVKYCMCSANICWKRTVQNLCRTRPWLKCRLIVWYQEWSTSWSRFANQDLILAESNCPWLIVC